MRLHDFADLVSAVIGTLAKTPPAAGVCVQVPPALPPGFGANDGSSSDNEAKDRGAASAFGPALPPSANEPPAKRVCGPTLPPGFGAGGGESSDDDDDQGTDRNAAAAAFGPALPPGFGPTRPNNHHQDDDDGDGVLGPMPCPVDVDEYARISIMREIEARARRTKEDLLTPKVVRPVREAWMTDLPEAKRKDFGTGARTFQTSASTAELDTSWAETPMDRQRRRADREAGRAVPTAAAAAAPVPVVDHQAQRMLQAMIEEHNSKPSLLDTHREKLHSKSKADAGAAPVRKAFDRETDLEMRRLDPRKKDDMLKSAAALHGRFAPSQGGQFR